MKTLLVLAQHPDFAETIRAALDSEIYRVVHRIGFEEAEPLLHQGLISACILDAELASVQWIWLIEKLRRRVPNCPLLVYAGSDQREWEEDAYLMGVAHIVNKPVRARLLNALLERSLSKAPAGRVVAPAPGMIPTPAGTSEQAPGMPPASPKTWFERWKFCAISPRSSLIPSARRPCSRSSCCALGSGGNPGRDLFARAGGRFCGQAPRRGTPGVCPRGAWAPSGLLEHFELSFEAGIGGHVRSGGFCGVTAEARADVEMQQEFELLGAQVAIPILDRETLIGVAVFDGRVTGEPLVNGELELIFHLLEELGLAIKNIWLHDQLAANHEMMADIFRQLSNACVVIGQDLTILHANKAAAAIS